MDLTSKYVGVGNYRHNPNLRFLEKEIKNYRVLALQGGTRSGKTFGAVHFLIRCLTRYSGLTMSIARETFPALRGSVMKDFISELKEVGMYSKSNHNKTYNEYHHGRNDVEFFSIDDEQKVRGRKRDIVFINEANEISLEVWRQLILRTTSKIIIDYNPSMPDSYIYDEVLPRNDCAHIVTTYKDNPHLPNAQVAEIELLRDTDPDYFSVFGLGQRGTNRIRIYVHYKVMDTGWPAWFDEESYGLDFGFNSPSCLMHCGVRDNSNFWKEELYEPGLNTPQLIDRLGNIIQNRNIPIYCDSAAPEKINDLNNAGFNAMAADKSVKDGIDFVQSRPLFIHADSVNTLKEIKKYQWKVVKLTGLKLDEPVKFDDHAMDGGRYGSYSHYRLQGFTVRSSSNR